MPIFASAQKQINAAVKLTEKRAARQARIRAGAISGSCLYISAGHLAQLPSL